MVPMISKKETGINLRKVMDMRGISAKDVQEYLGLGCVQSVYRWLEGHSMPTIDNLYALSKLLRVPIDDLVRGNREVRVPEVCYEVRKDWRKRVRAYWEVFLREKKTQK